MYPCHGEIEDVIAGLGGRFDPDQPDSIFSASLNGALDTATRIVGGARKNMNTQWANRPLDVTFVRNHDVNAFATKGERADHIVITLGAVQAIFGTMCALMASPSFLPEIGDVSKEEELQGPFPHGFPPMPLLQGNLPPDPSAVYHPRDARMAFALQLSEDALQFLVLHELGHILGGHLEVREARGLSPKLFEIGQYNSGPIGPELRQVLEYDADMFATHAQSFLAMQPEVAELLQNTFEWSNVSPEDAGVIMYTVAVSVLFRLLEADGPAPQAEPEIEYPHPAVRSNLVISKGLTLAHDADVITLEDLGVLQRLLEQSALEVEKIWSRFSLPGRRLGPSSDWARQVSDLGGELIEKHRQYADFLESHARLPRTWHGPWPKVD